MPEGTIEVSISRSYSPRCRVCFDQSVSDRGLPLSRRAVENYDPADVYHSPVVAEYGDPPGRTTHACLYPPTTT